MICGMQWTRRLWLRSWGVALILLGSTACSDDLMRLGETSQVEPVGSVDGMLLRDAASGTLIADLATNATLKLAELASPNVNLEAVVSGPLRSIEFVVDGESKVEVQAPFTYPGDIDGKARSFRAVPGLHLATATPYSAVGAEGKRGSLFRATFEFVE